MGKTIRKIFKNINNMEASTKNVDLNEDMILAILVGLDELGNTDEWVNHLEEGDYERIEKGISEIKNLISYSDIE